jgi:glycosyltransferase involved in cell wall biosynthesis
VSARESDYLATCRDAIARQPKGISLEEGFIAERDLPPLVGWCDAFLLPYGEFHSQSGVAMLALANGKPVIASAAGGLAELVQDGHNGILINGADDIEPFAIAAAIRRAQDVGKAGLAAFGRQGRASLEESTAWPVVGRQHDSMLKSLLQKSLP